MPYSAKAVANAIIQKAWASKQDISPLKLQKLLYYACGYYVAAYDKPLIDRTFEAWDYGPVVPSIYREFKQFGNGPIRALAADMTPPSFANLPVPPPQNDGAFDSLLEFVWSTFGKYSAVQLSEMTHAVGSPWYITRQKNPGIKDADIDRQALAEHFRPFITKKGVAA